MSIYGRTKGYITNCWRVTLKRTVRRSASLVTAVIVHCEQANYSLNTFYNTFTIQRTQYHAMKLFLLAYVTDFWVAILMSRGVNLRN